MENIRKYAEIGSNVAIILVALMLGYFIVGRYLATPNSPPKPVAETEVIKPGTKLALLEVDWSKSERNLLMVLSTTCRYCTESMPFYQRLVERNARVKDLRLIAVLPQAVEEARKYLGEHNLTVDEIVRAAPSEAMVRGTPTLLLLDGNGVVLQTWVGKLPTEVETEVLTAAFSKTEGP